MHRPEYVLLGRLAHGVLLVVGEDDHVLALVSKVLGQVGGHVPHVVDAPAQLAALAKVVDADQQGFPLAGALRVLEGEALGVAVAEALRGCRRWGRAELIRACYCCCCCWAGWEICEEGDEGHGVSM